MSKLKLAVKVARQQYQRGQQQLSDNETRRLEAIRILGEAQASVTTLEASRGRLQAELNGAVYGAHSGAPRPSFSIEDKEKELAACEKSLTAAKVALKKAELAKLEVEATAKAGSHIPKASPLQPVFQAMHEESKAGGIRAELLKAYAVYCLALGGEVQPFNRFTDEIMSITVSETGHLDRLTTGEVLATMDQLRKELEVELSKEGEQDPDQVEEILTDHLAE